MDHVNVEMLHPGVIDQINREAFCIRVHELIEAFEPWPTTQIWLDTFFVVIARTDNSRFTLLLIMLVEAKWPFFKIVGNIIEISDHGEVE